VTDHGCAYCRCILIMIPLISKIRIPLYTKHEAEDISRKKLAMCLTNVRRVALACIIIFFVAKTGYAMQPPPPPLNLQKLRNLISKADLIAVGKVGEIKEIESVKGKEERKTLEIILEIKKLLKGDISGKMLIIKETYPTLDSLKSGLTPMLGDKGAPQKVIIGLIAGPSCYHGRYRQGERIIVLLSKIKGSDLYRPLGSGTYDQYLCQFLIDNNRIKAFYFKFADDVKKYVASEEEFIGLIRSLINPDSEKGDE